VSWVAVRRIQVTGVAQRTISSTAVGAPASKSDCQISRCSGLPVSATRPWLIALRVVSLPATASRMKNEPISWSDSRSPSTSACASAVTRSWRGCCRRSCASSDSRPDSAAPEPSSAVAMFAPSGTYSGSCAPRITFECRNTSSQRSCGMPIIAQMTSSGTRAATCATKSPGPAATRSSTTDRVTRTMSASIRATIRGLNARATIRRSRRCRGASMLIIDPKYSRNSGGRSKMFVAPAAEE
jgi:hypothetical protein